MQIKASMKAVLSVFLFAVLLQGCNNTTESPEGGNGSPPQFPMNTSNLPILQINNWWNYTDGEGHHLSIQVFDTITDNKVRYYETKFSQEGVDTADDWFIQDSTGTEYGMNLLGPYRLFLPQQLTSESGTFSSDTTHVTYTYFDSLSLANTLFRNVIHLSYAEPVVYHGFSALDIADSIGIIRLVDSVGQEYPVVFELDSAFVGGQITRY